VFLEFILNSFSEITKNRAPIKDHSIFWNYKLENFVQIVIGKDGVLMPCELNLKIKQVRIHFFSSFPFFI
jgi:hypothetical protein